MRDPAYAGFVLRAWQPLKVRFPFLGDETLVGSGLKSIVAARGALARLASEHDANLARAASYAADLYHRVDGEVVPRFNIKSLPPKKAVPSLASLDAAIESPISIYQPPAPRKLSEIRRHTKYHEHSARLEAFDAKVDAATNAKAGPTARALRRRELTRFVSCSLPLAGHWKLDSTPVKSDLFLTTLQYSCGLYISEMVHANGELAADGRQADWLGDNSSETPTAAGERNTRHDVLNAAWASAVREGLGTQVVMCTKGNKANVAVCAAAAAAYADFNVGHIPDWGARGASLSGRHLVGETKCYNALLRAAERPARILACSAWCSGAAHLYPSFCGV